MNATVLVFSDSHGIARNMQKVIDGYNGSYDCVFFLGDGLRDAESLVIPSDKGKVFVRGNCDYYSNEQDTAVIELGGYRFFICHGHTLGVKYGLETLAAAARRNGADAALFGHTHVTHEECLTGGQKPLYLFNPGSISMPALGRPSFGVITATPRGILFSHGHPHDFEA